MDHPSKALTYSSYLKLDELLELQQPLSAEPEHDEMLFIVIHQIYELWFKQVLNELRKLQAELEDNDPPRALSTLKRILTIFKTLVAQVDVLETMTPRSFNSFRARLESASGFQSAQFREIEFLLGKKDRRAVEHHSSDSAGGQRLRRQMEKATLYDSLLRFLNKNGHDVPAELLGRDVTQPPEPSEAMQSVLLDVYRTNSIAAMVCEHLVDLDEGLQEWRYRHVKMVERTIGSKPGTGGSEGVAYLRSTLFQPLFPDLWAIRDRL
ncbi:MAG: tryptophan 2,3-dioxygenase family protein [Thermoanaerobaculia bacterium]